MTDRQRCPRCSLRHHPRCEPPVWPLEPLLAAVRSENPRVEIFRASSETWRNATEHGLPEAIADRWAVKAGFHPAQIWANWVEAGLTVQDAQFIESGWRQTFEWSEPMRSEAAA
jgi:hypothetical protein